jgi:hypothetical protein
MIVGSMRRRTSVNIARTRGGTSLSPGWYDGSAATTASIASSASAGRPNASRQNARYCSMARASLGRCSAECSRFNNTNASSYAADA